MKLLFTIIDNKNEVMPSLSSLLQNNDHIYQGIFNIPNLDQQIINANLIDDNDKPEVIQNIANLLSNSNSIEYAATLINNVIQNNNIQDNQNDQISQFIQNNVNNHVPMSVHFDDNYYDDNSMDLSGGDAGDDFLTAIFKFFGF
jgi:hypothetical protein